MIEISADMGEGAAAEPEIWPLIDAANVACVCVIREAFADRRYEPDGSLTPRSIAGSLLTIEEAAAQARLLAAEGVVIARDGSRIAIPCDTLCIHGDMAGSAERLRAIRAAL